MTQRGARRSLGAAALALLLGGLACSSFSGAAGEPPTAPPATPTRAAPRTPAPTDVPTETPTEPPTAAPTPETLADGILFADDFGDPSSGWGEAEDETARRAYRDGQYVFEIYDTGWFVWNNPGASGLSNTHTTVTVANVGEALDPTFGIICNYVDSGAFYYLGIGADGYYAIVRAEGEDDIFLTSDEDLWVHSEDIAVNAARYTLEALCAADGTLTLIVNGVEIASVQDDTHTQGDVGLFALSFEQVPVEVLFDDMTVVALEE